MLETATGEDGASPAVQAEVPLEERLRALEANLALALARATRAEQRLQVAMEIIGEMQEAQRNAMNHTIRAVQVFGQVMQSGNSSL